MGNFELVVVAVLLFIGYMGIRREIHSVKPKARNSSKKTEEVKKEMVYVAANPSYRPGVFKIGLTVRDVDIRMRELYTTGVPTPFDKCMIIESDDCNRLESELHDLFKEERITSRREWFQLSEVDIQSIRDFVKDKGHKMVLDDPTIITKAFT